MIILFGAYVWVMTSGHDRQLMDYVRSAYDGLVAWFDDAEVDFQVKSQKPKANKKKSRRWD